MARAIGLAIIGLFANQMTVSISGGGLFASANSELSGVVLVILGFVLVFTGLSGVLALGVGAIRTTR